jgi:prophage regulatory protein
MVKWQNRRLGVATGLGPSDRDVLLARLDRIEEVQERMLAMLTAESRKEQKTAPLPRPSSVAYDRLLRLPEVTSICGVSRSTIYLRIAQRLFPSPIQLGPRMIAWRESEIVALKAAQVRGAPENEIRELVGMLEAARKLTES